MIDPVETMFNDFADATEQSLSRMGDQLRAFSAKIDALTTEQRSNPVPVSHPTIDTDTLVTRVAALVPTPQDGKDGKDGRDGADGLNSPEEIAAQIREATALHFRDFYQGVYKVGRSYQPGLAATWDGSVWISTRSTNAKPGTDDSWTLAVKRGRDAKR